MKEADLVWPLSTNEEVETQRKKSTGTFHVYGFTPLLTGDALFFSGLIVARTVWFWELGSGTWWRYKAKGFWAEEGGPVGEIVIKWLFCAKHFVLWFTQHSWFSKKSTIKRAEWGREIRSTAKCKMRSCVLSSEERQHCGWSEGGNRALKSHSVYFSFLLEYNCFAMLC